MAYYLVHATPYGNLDELRTQLDQQEILQMQPFGQALHESLTNARIEPDGQWVWEEEDYCQPPLAMECRDVLDNFFKEINVEIVPPGEGWQRIDELPFAWREYETK